MNIKLLKSTLVLGLTLGLSLALHPAIGQDHPNAATAKATKSRGDANAPDPNIKHDRAANDPADKIPAPPEKGGPKTRQESCRIHIDNRTPLYISIYTDGNYRGQSSAYDDLFGYVGCGRTVFYAKATFTDGSVKTWGPSVYYVGSGTFTWTLTE